MRIVQTEITPGINSHLSLIERDESFFTAPFHFHPEFELVYIAESFGKRIIGDSIEPFSEGDMVFIGSGLPHIWQNDEIFYKRSDLKAKAIVLYFNKNIFSPIFFEMKEVAKMNEFFQNASRGIRINGKTKELVVKKLKTLLQKKGFEKVIGLFEILHILSLPTIANISNLTPQSFCRLFKKRTGKSFVEYLNEVRISAACRYLLDTDSAVSEIAYNCGYKTVSNFNKLFKNISGSSPKAYRESASIAVQKN